MSPLHSLTPFLLVLAAVLPALVASLNGVRYQSECKRLAERSAIMRTILRGPDPVALPKLSRFQCLFPSLQIPLSMPAAEARREGRYLAATQHLQAITAALTDPGTDPGSWTPSVLHIAESVAEVFMDEVSEWSVLYAKELIES